MVRSTYLPPLRLTTPFPSWMSSLEMYGFAADRATCNSPCLRWVCRWWVCGAMLKGIVTLYKQPWYYFLRDCVRVRCVRLGSREHLKQERDGAFFQCPSRSRRPSAAPENGPVERKVRTTTNIDLRQYLSSVHRHHCRIWLHLR